MSIATKKGDKGTTLLIGNSVVSKAHLRVEAYGTVDELSAAIAVARSVTEDKKINNLAKEIQQDLFTVSGSLANPRFDEAPKPYMTRKMINKLTKFVGKFESMEGVTSDWALPGDLHSAASFDLARTICRRAERAVVRLKESEENVDIMVITYLNRLSDLLWLIGRVLEVHAGVDSKLRAGKGGNKWSRTW